MTDNPMGTFRLALAWFVVAGHTPKYYDLLNLELGTAAVSAFFFISGFLMPMAYDTHYRESALWPGYKRFLVNRFLRIYPIYWLSLVLLILYGFLPLARGKIDQIGSPFNAWINYPQNFMLLGLNQSKLWGGYERFNNPAWTLDVELQFYVLVPLLIFALTQRRALVIIVAMTVASAVSLFLLYSPTDIIDVDRSLIAWCALFFLGTAFYRCVPVQVFFASRASLLLILPPLMLSLYPHLRTVAVTSMFVIIAAYLLVRQKNLQFGRMDQLAGDLSYPTYILHILIVSITGELLKKLYTHYGAIPDLAYFTSSLLINLLLTTIVAFCALRLVADPIDRLRARIKNARRQAKGAT